MIDDKTITIAAVKDSLDKLLYKGMFDVVWQNKYSQYSEQDKQNCLATWNLHTIATEYSLVMKEHVNHIKKVTATKQYKVINVPRNDNSQTIFRTQ